MNIQPILDSTKISLEKVAADKFGAAVDDFSRNVLGPALGVEATAPGNIPPANRNDGAFYASSYAAALAGANDFRPKLKFLFKVEFIFTKEARDIFPNIFGGSDANDFTFMVKSVDRPKIDFEYEDDVNMYNFRTKVLKKIRHRDLTITFHDDTGNRVLKFFKGLMMLNSPITRRQILRDGTTTPPSSKIDGSGSVGANGMQFSLDNNDIAIRGSIATNTISAIDAIRVKQVYVDPGHSLAGATKEVIFDFINARIVSFDLDDLNHEVSEANSITMQFDYDWMEIVDVGSLAGMDGPSYGNVHAPGINGAPVDMTVQGGTFDNPGGGNGVMNILSNQVGRGLQQLTSGAINSAVQSVAGKGRFASLIGSHASNIVGGIVGNAARNVTVGVGRQVSQAFARPEKGASNVIIPRQEDSYGTLADSAEGGPKPYIGQVSSSTTYYPDGTSITATTQQTKSASQVEAEYIANDIQRRRMEIQSLSGGEDI